MAEPTASDKETARRLMADGRAARKKGDERAALKSFLEADAIMHVPTTGLESAKSEIALGQLVEARDHLLAVVRLPIEENEPNAFGEARNAAAPMAAELQPRIPVVKLKLNGVPPNLPPKKLKVTIDGVAMASVAVEAPHAVDPGHHIIIAQIGKGDPAKAEIDILERETKDVALDVPPDLSPPEPTPGPSGEPGVAQPPPPRDPGPWPIVTFTSGGVGVAGFIMGAVTGILAMSDLSAAKKADCETTGGVVKCGPGATSDLNSANTMATLSTVGFIVGGVGVAGAGAGALLWRRAVQPSDSAPPPAAPGAPAEAPKEEAPAPPPPPAASIRLYFGPTSVGAFGTF
jgi:hypothetical protein